MTPLIAGPVFIGRYAQVLYSTFSCIPVLCPFSTPAKLLPPLVEIATWLPNPNPSPTPNPKPTNTIQHNTGTGTLCLGD